MVIESKAEEEKGDGDKSGTINQTSETIDSVTLSEVINNESKFNNSSSQVIRPVLQHQSSSGHKVQFADDTSNNNCDDSSDDSDVKQASQQNEAQTIKCSPQRKRSSSSLTFALRNQRQSPRHQRRRTFSETSGKSSVVSASLSRTSSSSSSDSEASTTYSFTAPDGGWGWIVVIASFLVNMIADGITFSFGVFFVELQREFKESKALTAGVVSLFHAVPLLSGPIASALTDRYGCRWMTILGSIISTFGFLLSSFCHSLEWLYITFGLIAGFGLSLCYVSAIVIVAYYFDRKRSFATGISVCGSGVGTFLFAPLTQYLVKHFGGWRGTCRCLSLFLFSMVLCGIVFRDLSISKHISKSRKSSARSRSRSRSISFGKRTSFTSNNSMPGIVELKGILESGDINEFLSKEESLTEEERVSTSLVNIPTYITTGEKLPNEFMNTLSKNPDMFNALRQMYPEAFTSNRFDNFAEDPEDIEKKSIEQTSGLRNGETEVLLDELKVNETGDESIEVKLKRKVSSLFKKRPNKSILKNPSPNQVFDGEEETLKKINDPIEQDCRDSLNDYLGRFVSNNIEQQGYNGLTSDNSQHITKTMNLHHLKIRRQSLTYRGAMLNISRYRLRTSSCPDIYRNSMATLPREDNETSLICLWLQDLLDNLGQCFQWHLFSLKFVIFCISNFILYAWYDVMYVYLVDYADHLGFPDQKSTMLISILGILNTFGEIIIGYFGDRSWMNLNFLYTICMIACGISTALVPSFTQYHFLVIMAGIYGFAISANYSLTSPILVELVTIEQFSSAYGFLLLVQGISNLLGPPLAGFMYDLTQEWWWTFGLSGGFILISGAMLMLPCINKKKEKPWHREASLESGLDGQVESLPTEDKNPNYKDGNIIIENSLV